MANKRIHELNTQTIINTGDVMALDNTGLGEAVQITTDNFQSALSLTESQISDLNHTDTNAYHDNVSGEINATTDKATPVDTDVMLGEDSANTYSKIKVTWANIKATMKTYFDTLYAAVSHTHTAGDMDSELSTDGQVLTSDGAGNAAWEDAAGGGGSNWSVAGNVMQPAVDGDGVLIDVPTASRAALVVQTTDDDSTKNVLEIHDSTGSLLSGFSSNGKAAIGTSPDTTTLLVKGDGTNPIFNAHVFNTTVRFEITNGGYIEAAPQALSIGQGGIETAFYYQADLRVNAGGSAVGYGNRYFNSGRWQNTAGQIYGFNISNQLTSTTVTANTGSKFVGFSQNNTSTASFTGKIDSFVGFENVWELGGTGTITNVIDIDLSTTSISAIATNRYGLRIGDITEGGSTNYAIYTNAGDVSLGDNVDIRSGNLLLSTGDLILSAGKIGVGTASPTNDLSLGGDSARTIWLERHTTSNTAGNSLTVQAGGSATLATDKAGGSLILAPGLSTGATESGVQIMGSAAGISGTQDNALAKVIEVLGNKAFIYNLPTSDPAVPGQLWRSGTAVQVSV